MNHSLIRKIVTYAKKKLKILLMKNIVEFEITAITQVTVGGGVHSKCNLRYKMPKEITVEETEAQYKCLGVNAEKNVTFSVPIQKEIGNNKTIKI